MTNDPNKLLEAAEHLLYEVRVLGDDAIETHLVDDVKLCAEFTARTVAATQSKDAREAFETWHSEHGNPCYTIDQEIAWQAALAYAAAQPAQASGWRPISEAPKDGTRVLATELGMILIVKWEPDETDDPAYVWIDDSGTYCNPTHYQPLPPPPKGGSEHE